jgi:long-chain acyl-CoA synthetase
VTVEIETIPSQFLHSVETFDKKNAFRHKVGGKYVDVSHREALDRVHHATLALQALGLAKGDRVALLSENRVEWALADLAILSAGCITVPVYPTVPPVQVEYILSDSGARAIFVSTPELLDKVRACRPRLGRLQHVICFDLESAEEGVVPFEALVERGRMVEPKPAYRDVIATIGKYDWASIIYTSGTTGDPKGVILTHWNFISNVRAALEVFEFGPKDSCLSFLPLSHSFERTAGYYVMITAGATIAYAESVDTVADNMGEVRPTVMLSVPRLYEKMYARVLDTVEKGSPTKQRIFRWAVASGRRYVTEKLAGGVSPVTAGKRQLASALAFRKLKARTGGRMRFFVSGGAPLSREIAEFFYAAGLPILEGYGVTETTPVISANTFENFRFGTVGKPLPGVDVRIAEDGEIIVRGENVMQGYYKKPDATNEAIKDGWYYTGDIGHLDEDGFIVITDRKKDLIITAGGKNVAPAPIENKLKQSPFIGEAVLFGDRRRFISALIVPRFEKLEEYATAAGIPYHDRAALVASPEVQELYQREMDAVNAELANYEQTKKFVLVDREFTVEDGELTPSLKIKRRVVELKFRAQIDALYAE